MFALTTPNAALEGSRHSVGHSVSNGSSYSCSRPPTVHHCTPASCSELSPTRSSRKSFRRLPTPPIYVSASPSISTPPLPMPSSSTSSPSLSPPQRPPPRSRSPRPLPKIPKAATDLVEIPNHIRIDERSSPAAGPATSKVPIVLPQRPTHIEEIQRGNLTELRLHLGNPIAANLIPPRLDRDETFDSSSDDEEDYDDLPTVPITPRCISKLAGAISPILDKTADEKHDKMIRRYSKRWLREKKGRRWVEDNYDTIIQSLRELR